MMSFDELAKYHSLSLMKWDEDFYASENTQLAKAFYEAGQQSKQQEIDELIKSIDWHIEDCELRLYMNKNDYYQEGFKVKVLHHNVIEFLEKEGFKPSTSRLSLYDCDLFYYKRTTHKDTKYCICNDRVPQICVKAYSYDAQGRTCTSYGIEICQDNDLGWIKFDYYCIKEDQLINNFNQYEESLIKSWEASFKGD